MRYLPKSPADRELMLREIGVKSIDDFFASIPAEYRLNRDLKVPRQMSEQEIMDWFKARAAENTTGFHIFLGAGAYNHYRPIVIDSLISRGEFFTAYTPYQPEIAQGTLQYIFEFQTQVALLTDMEVANASMYDGSTGTAEAVLMAHRVTKRRKAILSGGLHPHYAEVVRTQSRMSSDEVITLDPDVFAKEDLAALIDAETSCVVVQTPDVFGNLRDLTELAEICKARGALLIAVFTEAVSLGLVKAPGSMGADIVVGEGQSIGNSLNFGGPYVGLFATRSKYIRQMPGRLCGETVDAEGKRGFVLTLSTREQHIRRDKATSNICTNSGLCCLAFTIHLTLLGEAGLRRLARINHANAVQLADRLEGVKGVEVLNETFFNEFTIRIKGNAVQAVERMAEKGVLGGVPVARLLPGKGLDDLILVASTEVNTDEDRAAFADALQGAL